MAQRNDYSIQLPDSQASVKGNAGELRIAAAQSRAAGINAQAQGEATGIGLDAQATAQTIGFLGTQARAAGKGFLEAKETDEINATLDKLEGFGEGAKQAEKNIIDYTNFLNEKKATSSVDPAFLQEAQRYLDAQRSGIMSRAEVLTRIGKTVKEYSALMPGMAADFRKVGAELTGINNLDVYGVHKALTEKGGREKAAEAEQAANLQLLKDVAEFKGYTKLGQVTEEDKASFQTYKALKTAAETATLQAQKGKQVQEVADAGYHKATSVILAKEVETLSNSLDKLTTLATSGKSEDSNAATAAANILLNDIQRVETRFTKAVLSMTQPNKFGGTPLSEKYAQDEILAKVRPMFSDYKEAVKNIEGRDLFKKLVDSSKLKREALLNTFYLAHPAILLHKDTGTFPKLYEAYIALNSDDKEAAKRFGATLAEQLKVLKNYDGVSQLSNLQRQVVGGKEVDTDAVSTMSPAMGAIHKANLLSNVQELAKNPTPTDQVKEGWTQNARELTRQLKYGTVNDAKVANDVFGSPDVAKFVASLSPVQRQTALSPLVRGTGEAANAILAETRQLLADPASMLNEKGSKVELVVSPLTGLVEVRESGFPKPENVGAGALGRLVLSASPRVGALEKVKQTVNQMNQLVQAHTTAQGLLGVKEGAVEVSTKLLSGGLNVLKNTESKAAPRVSQFVQEVVPLLGGAAKELGVDPVVLATQLGLETGWGQYVIKGTNNLGNIKDFSGGGVPAFDKAEGSTSKYRVYASIEDFVSNYTKLLAKNWPGVLGAGGDIEKFAMALKPGEQGGYATDKAYVKKLVDSYRMVVGR